MRLFAFVLLLLSALPAVASDSLIRIDCLENTGGGQVYLDNQYQFECEDFLKKPILVTAGEHEVRVVRPVDEDYEQVFTTTLQVAAGVPQRVRVSLPEKTLTDLGRQRQQQRQEQARIAREQERQRQLQAAVQQNQELAAEGDLEAMQRLAQRYAKGDGVSQSQAQAEHWQQQYEVALQEQNRRERIANLQQRLEINSYFFHVKATPRVMARDSGEGSTYVTSLPAATTMDILSIPTVYSERAELYEQLQELETHAARWANPDAMVSKAFSGR